MLYFNHDTSASTDRKIMQLRLAQGGAAVDAYWYLIEQMCLDERPICVRNADAMPTQCERNADAMRVHCHTLCTDEKTLEKWIEYMVEIDLLHASEDGCCIYSERAMSNIEGYQAKQEQASSAAKKRWGNANAMRTQCERNADAMPSKSKSKSKSKSRKKESTKEKTPPFHAPTVDEVRDYCTEKGYAIDPERFCDYYGAQGWKLSNGNPMKDWKRAANNWARDDKERKAVKDEEDKRYEAFDHVW